MSPEFNRIFSLKMIWLKFVDAEISPKGSIYKGGGIYLQCDIDDNEEMSFPQYVKQNAIVLLSMYPAVMNGDSSTACMQDQ